MVGGNKFSITSPPFSSTLDDKYTPPAFSGLLSFGVFLTLCSATRNMGQKTVTDWLQQESLHCSANNLVSKGSCESQADAFDRISSQAIGDCEMNSISSSLPTSALYTVLNKCPRKELELATNFSATHGLIVQIPLFREVHTELFYLLFLEEIF